jgi:arabinose-5-phosphate isomerase
MQGGEWAHGDLGSVRAGDVIIAFSHSGRTAELVELAERVGKLGVHMIAVTGNAASPLARVADVHLTAEADRELIGAIPTRSVIAQEAVSNALVSAVVDASGLSLDRFRASHPGGSIGAAHDAEGS